MRAFVSCGLAVVAVLAVAGCGGGANASHLSGESSSQSQLIVTADAICGRLNAEINAATPTHLTLPEVARLAPRNASLERAALKELSGLTPPASLEQDWRHLTQYLRSLASELVTLGHDAKANNTAGIRALAASKGRVHRALLATATRDGFKSCSQVG